MAEDEEDPAALAADASGGDPETVERRETEDGDGSGSDSGPDGPSILGALLETEPAADPADHPSLPIPVAYLVIGAVKVANHLLDETVSAGRPAIADFGLSAYTAYRGEWRSAGGSDDGSDEGSDEETVTLHGEGTV